MSRASEIGQPRAARSPGAELEFSLLGPLLVRVDGRPLELTSGKERGVLAVLLLHRGERVSRDHLLDELWGEAPPSTALHALHVHVSKLRKALGDGPGRKLIATAADGYVLTSSPEQVDTCEFERLARAGRSAYARDCAATAAKLFAKALALWRGPALGNVRLEGLDRVEVERLEELRVSTLEDRVDADLAVGRDAELVGELARWIARYPLRERLRAQMMLALYRAGRQAEALAAYREARRTFISLLGIEPSPSLRELERRILGHDPGLARRERTPAPAPAGLVSQAVRSRRSAGRWHCSRGRTRVPALSPA